MKSLQDLPLIWTPRRAAVKVILSGQSKTLDPSVLLPVFNGLDAMTEKYFAGESDRRYARKAATFLIALYADALTALAKAMDECILVAMVTAIFVHKKQLPVPECVAQVTAARNKLAIARGAMGLLEKTRLRTAVLPAEFETAISALDMISASILEILCDTNEDAGLLERSARVRESKRQLQALELTIREKAEETNPARTAVVIHICANGVIERFYELIFLLRGCDAQWHAEIDHMMAGVPKPARASAGK